MWASVSNHEWWRSAKPGEMRNLATSCRKIWQRVVKLGEAMKGRHPQTSVSIAVTFEEEKNA